MRVLGVDYGAARVGLALGDTEVGIAGPWRVLPHTDDARLVAALLEIVKREDIQLVVVGIPYPLADQTRETAQALSIRRFVNCLEAAELRVCEENETWSSSLAAKQGREAGIHGKRDDLAAANILQGFLDRRSHALSS